MPGSVDLYEATFSGNVPRVRFGPNGLPNGMGRVRISNNEQTLYRQISISLTGFTKIRTSQDGDNWKC